MRIAKIKHSRCDEYRATTYVWVADDMTESQLQDLVDAARTQYLAALEAFKNDPKAPPYPGYNPDYEKHPTLRVEEVKALHAEKVAVYKAWEQKKAEARQPFAKFLIAVGEGRIQSFYEGSADALSVKLHWGHRHGETLEYEEISPDSNDFNIPQGEGEEGAEYL